MNEWLTQLSNIIDQSRQNLPLTLAIIAALWVIHLFNAASQQRLSHLAIIPRTESGLLGIFLAPLLHANFAHLLFNSLPLFLLINLTLLYGLKAFIVVTLIIALVGGFFTWLLGRTAIHLGASGVIMGYWSFLLLNAYLHPGVLGVFVAILCLYYLSGLFLQIIPKDQGVSWESHLYGFLAGLLAAWALPHILPNIPMTN